MTKRMYGTPRILHDEPLQESENAFFHFEDFAITIARLIADNSTRTPLTIAINGSRGSGRTTLLRKIKELLDQTISLKNETNPAKFGFLNPNELTNNRYRVCKTIWFNARRYANESEIIAALLRIIVRDFQKEHSWDALIEKIADPANRIDFGIMLDALSKFTNIITFREDLIKYKTSSTINTPAVFFDYFDETFDGLLASFVYGGVFDYKQIDSTKGCIVIFVDDLDKCLPEKIVQMLEGINLFLSKVGVVFVLGTDIEYLAQGIISHYKNSGITGESSKDYLEETIQIRFDIPPISTGAMTNYIEAEKDAITEELARNWQIILSGAESSPRRLKTIVNDLNLQWAMLVNTGQAEGIRRDDFIKWQVLIRSAPLQFIRQLRDLPDDLRYHFLQDAMRWAQGDDSVAPYFQEYSNSRRLRRVLREIAFSENFTPIALDTFISLMIDSRILNSQYENVVESIQNPSSTELPSVDAPHVIKKSDDKQSISADIDLTRQRKIFLCHSHEDKSVIRNLYQRLKNDGIKPWLDAEDLIPGQNWELEIKKVISASDAVLVCISPKSVNQDGYVHKEIKMALDIAEQKPEGSIYIIPVKLENCDVPDRLRRWHWVDLFEDGEYDKLLRAIKSR